MAYSFTVSELKTAHRILVSIQKGELIPEKKNFGICDTLKYYSWDAYQFPGLSMVRRYSPSWKEFSGDPNYPVPSDNPNMISRYKYCFTDDLWDKDTEYGQARYRLVDHLIKCIEKNWKYRLWRVFDAMKRMLTR